VASEAIVLMNAEAIAKLNENNNHYEDEHHQDNDDSDNDSDLARYQLSRARRKAE
jgi:hypothetical protein